MATFDVVSLFRIDVYRTFEVKAKSREEAMTKVLTLIADREYSEEDFSEAESGVYFENIVDAQEV